MNLKLKKEHEVVLSFDSLMEDDYGVVDDLTLLSSNIKGEFYGILYSFLSFLKIWKEKRSITCFHWCLTLDSKTFV